ICRASRYGGSNPSLPTITEEREAECGSNSGVESQPSKLLVAGSIPVSRSNGQAHRRGHKEEITVTRLAHVAQSVEHVLGKDEVTSSILVVGSIRRPGPVEGRRETEGEQKRRGVRGADEGGAARLPSTVFRPPALR